MKYFVVADVHSYFNELNQALDKAGFDINNPEHIFVSLGDLLDRGAFPLKCLKFVNSLPEERKILIRGNHERLLDACLKRKVFTEYDVSNGTAQTICDLGNYDGFKHGIEYACEKLDNDSELNKYRNSLRDYYETDKYVFVHGWIPCGYKADAKDNYKTMVYTFDDNWRNGNWEKAAWINGMDAWSHGIKIEGKTIFAGHWHTSWGHAYLHNFGVEWGNPYSMSLANRVAHFEPFEDDGIVAMDACTAYSHKVNCKVVEE